MTRAGTPRLTYANAMSTLAVFIALGGSAYAGTTLARNSVHSGQIANGAVKRADLAPNAVDSTKVADGSLLTRDFKAGQLPAGAPGPAGPAGPAGPKGASGATNVVVRTSSGHGVQRTDCLPGEVATGGGAHSPDGYVVASIPAVHPQAPFAPNGPPTSFTQNTSWEARAVTFELSDTGTVTGVQDADLTTWVVCATP